MNSITRCIYTVSAWYSRHAESDVSPTEPILTCWPYLWRCRRIGGRLVTRNLLRKLQFASPYICAPAVSGLAACERAGISRQGASVSLTRRSAYYARVYNTVVGGSTAWTERLLSIPLSCRYDVYTTSGNLSLYQSRRRYRVIYSLHANERNERPQSRPVA